MNTFQQQKDSILSDLAALGNHPLDIATKLYELNCQGKRQEPESCPIYHYLRLKGRAIHSITATYIALKMGDDFFAPILSTANIIFLPPMVREFIHQFDNGCYPNLELDVG
jgi:hypothetical protein